MKALRQNSTPSYKFSQIPELIQCLLVSDACGGPGGSQGRQRDQEAETTAHTDSTPPPPPPPAQCILQKEPNFLTTLFREKIILVIVGLR